MSKAIVIPERGKSVGGTMKDEIYSLSPSEKKDSAMGLFSRLLRFDSLGRRSSPDSPTATESPTTYYGVYIPCEIKKGPDEETLHVYKNKSDALELVRRYKLARFKAFRNRQDAVSFALRGAEPQDNADGHDNSLVGEKPYPFKAPSPQEMVSLRKAIEAGLAEDVRTRVLDNPRYLVSSGNTPAIMQEGCRYNALHIAAKAKNAELCNLILNTVGDPAFVQTLYGGDADHDSCKEFAEILVDRYLNTPDKAMHETPLHYAAKFGAEAVVDVLTSFTKCDKNVKNKHGQTPKDVICQRVSAPDPSMTRRISTMLEERYYVPVLHTDDGSAAPTIGRAFTPAEPPTLNTDPLSPRYEIRAFAGPMRRAAADDFRRKWKTPPRIKLVNNFRLKDIAKGLEVEGRSLAEELKVDWKEYWPFLDTFTDLRTDEGMTLLENYLKAKYETACSFAYSDSCIEAQQSPEELTISRLTLGHMSPSPNKDNTLSPMSELCVALKTCKITDRPSHWKKTDPVKQRLCRQPSVKKISNGDSTPPINHTVSQLLCIERTCQVFAKRIADALTFSLTAEPEVAGESLKSEAKHLQHTIFTYMDDERFQTIDFALIHSRLAQLVVYKLKQQTSDLDDINNLVEFLIKLRCPNDDIFSSDDERKPFNFRGPNRVKLSHVIDGQVRCLASFICEELTETDATKGPAISESECTELWQKASKCRCDWKIDVFERNSKKNASFRKNRSILSTSPKNESFIRRLTFDHDIGDGSGQQRADAPRAVNSPSGDATTTTSTTTTSTTTTSTPTHTYTIDVANCTVVDAEISSDESPCLSDCPDGDDDAYETASEHSEPHDKVIEGTYRQIRTDDDDNMHDASDTALAEPFIYGEEPTKMDRLVYDAISECNISCEKFPNVYRWRHTVALYSPTERERWQPPVEVSISSNCSMSSPCGGGGGVAWRSVWSSPSHVHTNHHTNTHTSPAARSTPHKQVPSITQTGSPRHVPLQVSNWLRVTGPNSPRSAIAKSQVSHNVSFGF